MFRSAAIKLTAFYFSLLFLVCFLFSFQAYVLASERITRGAENQEQIFRSYGNFPAPLVIEEFDPIGEVRERIDRQVANDRRRLLNAIVSTDLIILTLGTVLCFFVAKRTLKPIEELHRAQTRFTADASHELRTPLAVMKTEIEVALRQKLSANELTDVLNSNLEEVARLTQLSDQLLALTRPENNQNFDTFNLSDLITDELTSISSKYSIEIERAIDDGVQFRGSKALVKDLVNILVTNAIQYSGDSKARIAVSLKTKGDNIELTVKDEGIGIAKDEQTKIFERFYRGTKAIKTRSSGHGLGLSLAKEIVKRHNGKISVASEPDKFTEFKIIFPSN